MPFDFIDKPLFKVDCGQILVHFAKNFRIKDDHQNTENNVKTMRLRAVNQQNEAGESNDDASA